MCGIVGYLGKEKAIENLIPMLLKLEYRGYDSAGAATIFDGKLFCFKNVGHIIQALPDSEVIKLEGYIGISHTRWSTHGEVTKENAHPHLSCDGKIAIVHNGIIDNYEELKQTLVGHIFKSETDTEVISHLIEEYCKDLSFENAVMKTCKELKGSFAFAVIHSDYPDRIIVARKDSPILFGKNDDALFVASDYLAFSGRVKYCVECPDDSIAVMTLNEGIKIIADTYGNKKDIKLTCSQNLNIVADINKGKYPHYMLKEIYEQPNVLVEALKQDKNKLIGVALEILRAKDMILTACGTSRYACIVGRYLISKLAKKWGETIVSSELQYNIDSFGDSTLILAVSQSGETADVLAGIKLAKQKGSHIISIVNKPYSYLERLSDVTLFMNCGAEISVASTKAFTNELVIFYLLAFTMANKYDEGMIELSQLPDKIKECLAQVDKVKQVAEIVKNAEHIYYIGKGINFAVAGECALKLKEVSYIHAESMSAGELKHGTLSLIDKGVPVIGLCPDDYTYQETISNLHEAKARKGLIIGISDKYNSVFDYWLQIPTVKDIYYPLVSVIIGQLLAYYVAVDKGLNPDFPKNLAKSCTVC